MGRRLNRIHQWARPNESVVESIFEKGHLEQMYKATRDFRGPIPILGLPQVSVVDGLLIATPLGEGYSSLREFAGEHAPRTYTFQGKEYPLISGGAGFASLSDLISEATTGGKSQDLVFQKTGATGVANASNTLWFAAGQPAAGSIGAALAGGTDTTSATTGALKQRNPTGGDTLHIVTCYSIPSVANNTLLLFDRIWHGAPAVSTAGAQTVTMTPTRYSTTGSTGTSKFNFVTLEINTNLGATAHTWTIQYNDDSGNTVETTAGNVGLSSGITPRLDVAASAPWSAVLNSGDFGVSDLTQFTMGASVTGATNLVLGHPLAFIPQPVAQQMVILDGINSAFNLVQVVDDACLSFFELYKLATTATQYNGIIKLVAG